MERSRCWLRTPSCTCQDGGKPVLQDASIAEDILEIRFERRDVEQSFVHVTDDDARHAATSLCCGESVSDSGRVCGAG
jgi:hypothetical protein